MDTTPKADDPRPAAKPGCAWLLMGGLVGTAGGGTDGFILAYLLQLAAGGGGPYDYAMPIALAIGLFFGVTAGGVIGVIWGITKDGGARLRQLAASRAGK